MKRCVVNLRCGFVNIPADRMEREEDVIFVYNGDELMGMFSLGSLDHIYLSEKNDERR